jgi:hypothetical protein
MRSQQRVVSASAAHGPHGRTSGKVADAVRAADVAWLKAYTAKDLDKAVAFCDEQGSMLMPNAPIATEGCHCEIDCESFCDTLFQAHMASLQCRRRPFRRTWLYERHIRTEFQRRIGENYQRQGEVSNRMEKTPGQHVESVVRHVQFRPAPGLAALADFDLLVGRRLGCQLIGSGLPPLHPLLHNRTAPGTATSGGFSRSRRIVRRIASSIATGSSYPSSWRIRVELAVHRCAALPGFSKCCGLWMNVNLHDVLR